VGAVPAILIQRMQNKAATKAAEKSRSNELRDALTQLRLSLEQQNLQPVNEYLDSLVEYLTIQKDFIKADLASPNSGFTTTLRDQMLQRRNLLASQEARAASRIVATSSLTETYFTVSQVFETSERLTLNLLTTSDEQQLKQLQNEHFTATAIALDGASALRREIATYLLNVAAKDPFNNLSAPNVPSQASTTDANVKD
jgi:hypothetical protein